MKLVVCYSVSDGFTYHCDVVRCFEYESDTAWLCNFEKILRSTIEKFVQSRKLMDAWESAKPVFGDPMTPKQQAQHDKWFKTCPNVNYEEIGTFQFAGQTFNLSEFYERVHEDLLKSDIAINLPEVYELDVWFLARCRHE